MVDHDVGPCERALALLGSDHYVASLVYTYLLAPENSLEEDCLRILVERHFPDTEAREIVLETASTALSASPRRTT